MGSMSTLAGNDFQYLNMVSLFVELFIDRSIFLPRLL